MGLSINYPASGTSRVSVTIPKGFMRKITKEIQIIIPDTVNVVTFTFDIQDELGKTRYSISNLAKNTAHLLLVERVVKPDYSFGMTASGNTGTAITININPEYY